MVAGFGLVLIRIAAIPEADQVTALNASRRLQTAVIRVIGRAWAGFMSARSGGGVEVVEEVGEESGSVG